MSKIKRIYWRDDMVVSGEYRDKDSKVRKFHEYFYPKSNTPEAIEEGLCQFIKRFERVHGEIITKKVQPFFGSKEHPCCSFANIHYLVGYNERKLRDYRDMLVVIQETFPEATEDNVICSVVIVTKGLRW